MTNDQTPMTNVPEPGARPGPHPAGHWSLVIGHWSLVIGLFLALPGCAKKPPYQGRSVDELRQMLADPDPKVQAQGAIGLSRLGPEAAPAVPALIDALKSPNAYVRQQAALALGKVGPE